ncbi:MAG: ACP S-malonyltransferase [Thermoleophilia bacterium]|nr:ACP S-malonyltransferase [Thermoleophilia bacterium]
MSGVLLLFPGQGSQAAGMAEYLWQYPVARDTFAEAAEVLGWDIGGLCRTGSMEELTRTDRTQLAILTCSVAVWRVLQEAGAEFAVAAGHSLGEYSALVAAGYLSFADALRVVEARGRAMLACAEKRGGTMAAVIGLEDTVVEEVCTALTDVWPANYNCPGQVVISGAAEAVEEASQLALERGAKRVLPLPVSGAFHTPFMAGAAEDLARALDQVTFHEPDRAVAPEGHETSVDKGGRFFSTTEVRFPDVSELKEVLARQLTSPVRFTQSMQALLAAPGAPKWAVEVGPGNVLAGLVKRIARDLPVQTTGDTGSLEEVLKRWTA